MFKVKFKVEEEYRPMTYPQVEQNRYIVSNYGNIIDITLGRQKTLFYSEKGYRTCELSLSVYKKRRFRKLFVHRLVAWAFIDGYDPSVRRIWVNHKDGTKSNNYFKNLEWSTIRENAIHARTLSGKNFKNPPIMKGETNPASIWTRSQANLVYRMIRKGMGNIEIMKELGYSCLKDNKSLYDLVRDIRRKRIWGELRGKWDNRIKFNDYRRRRGALVE